MLQTLNTDIQRSENFMGNRLSTKHAKRRKDKAVAYAKGEAPAAHKVAVERSKKAKFRKNNRSC